MAKLMDAYLQRFVPNTPKIFDTTYVCKYVFLGCTCVNIFHIRTSSSCLETQVKLSFSTARKFYILTKLPQKS
jgi:hypothetical protein